VTTPTNKHSCFISPWQEWPLIVGPAAVSGLVAGACGVVHDLRRRNHDFGSPSPRLKQGANISTLVLGHQRPAQPLPGDYLLLTLVNAVFAVVMAILFENNPRAVILAVLISSRWR